jgi:hypothetical protein
MENKTLEALKYASVIIAESSHKNNTERTECYGMVLEAIKEEEEKEQPSAKLVAEYLEVYQNYIWDNGLADDSKEIGVRDLIDFVKDNILNE